MPNWDSPASEDASSKRRRGAKKTSAAKKTSKTSKKARKTNKKTTAKRTNRWLKVGQWENLVNGKRNATAPSKGKGRKSMEVTPLPGFNCAKSNKGCVCCCEPFVPVNGICQMADESEVASTPEQEHQPVVGEVTSEVSATTGTPAFEIAHHGHPTTVSEGHHSEFPETTQAPEKPAQEEQQKPEAEAKPEQPEEAAFSSSSDNQEDQQQAAQEHQQQADESSSATTETEESKKRRRTEKQRSELPKDAASGSKPGSMTVVSQTSVTINKKQQQKMKQGQQQSYQKP
jgi:hypothetical protein